jgi:hypothetical protein
MTPPFYDRQPSDGLHVLKDFWTQKSYMGPQSQLLRDNLEVAINATYEAAHLRVQGFELGRPTTEVMHDRSRERRLEGAMLQRWNQPGMWRIPGGWERLVAFQTPLFAQQLKEQWGYIDLLGINAYGLPIVVELKKGPDAGADGKTSSSETPLRMVLEAAAYAVSLRKNWGVKFRTEWVAHLVSLGLSDQVISKIPDALGTVPLVAAAPASFWIDWLPVTEKGQSVTRETWLSFQALVAELKAQKLPVSFVSISGHDKDTEGLAVQPLDFPFIC